MNYHTSPDQQIRSGLFSRTFFTLFVAVLVTASAAFAQSPEVRRALRLIDIEQPSKGIAALE